MIAAPPRLLTAPVRAARARAAGVIALLLAAAAFVDPDRPLPIDLCLLKRVAGVPCPTCGLTRAICHALRGDFAASLSLHPAGLIALSILIGWGAWAAAEAWRGQPLWDNTRRSIVRVAASAAAAVTVAAWIATMAARF